MRTRRALLAVAAAAAALAGTLTAAATGTGGGSVPAASSIVASRDVTVLRRAELERIGPRRAAAGAVASAKSAKLSYYTTVNFETVVPGGDELYEIRCPARRQPLTGGVLSAHGDDAAVEAVAGLRAQLDRRRPQSTIEKLVQSCWKSGWNRAGAAPLALRRARSPHHARTRLSPRSRTRA